MVGFTPLLAERGNWYERVDEVRRSGVGEARELYPEEILIFLRKGRRRGQ